MSATGDFAGNGRFLARIKTQLQTWLRRDSLAMLLYALVTIIMTYPLAVRLGQNWLGTVDADTFVKIWDIYWLEHFRATQQSFFYTHDMFYPTGLDLSFHSLSWTVATVSWLLTPILGLIDAYNVTILAAVWMTAYAGYLLINSLVSHRTAAWVGGAVYSLAPYHIAHTGGHPDLVHLAPVPLAALFFMQAVNRTSKRYAVMAGLMVGLAAMTSLYIMDFTLLTLVPIFVFFALEQGRWRQRGFWETAVVFGIAAALFLFPRLYTIFRSSDALSFAIESKYYADFKQTDLLAYFIPSQHNPLFEPFVQKVVSRFIMNKIWPAYVGIVPIGLTVLAATWKKHRFQVSLWGTTGLMFFILSLGTVLRFNGQVYENLTMPAYFVSWFPPVRAVARPDFFVLGVLLPLGVCAAFGLDRWLMALQKRRISQIILPIGLTVFLMFEYWNGPYAGYSVRLNPFYAQLAHDDDMFALIELPMGRQRSKPYIFFQTFHQKPLVEGLSARTPIGAYRYINNNALLYAWRKHTALDCDAVSNESLQTALTQLEADNFRYVIVHQVEDKFPKDLVDYFMIDPVYRDAQLSAYRVADLREQVFCAISNSNSE